MRKHFSKKLAVLTAAALVVSGIYCPTGKVLAEDDLTADYDYDNEEQVGTKISDLSLSNKGLIEFVNSTDIDADGYISTYEAERVTYLASTDAATQSELDQVLGLYSNITELRWDSGTATTITFPAGNKLQRLYITTKASKQVEISGISQSLDTISYMTQGSSKYTFDFSKNDAFKNAATAMISGKQINAIKFPSSAKVERVEISQTNVSTISISSAKITSLGMYSNSKLKSATIKNCSKLTNLSLYNGAITKLTISGCPKLSSLGCENNKLTKLDVSKYKNLENLYCGRNKISKLNIKKNTKLTSFYCNDNKLTSVDTSKNKKLNYFNCSNNKIKKISVSSNSKLNYLSCYGNKFTKVNLKKNKQLTSMSAGKTYKLLSSFIPAPSKTDSCYIYVEVKKGTKLNLVKYAPALKKAKFTIDKSYTKQFAVSKKGVITSKKYKYASIGLIKATLNKKEYNFYVTGV